MKTKYLVMIGVFVLMIGVFTLVLFPYNDNIYFENNGVTLSEQDYLSIQEEFPEQEVRVCNIENKNCIIFIPLT